MISNYRSYYKKEPEQRCMTDHRIKIIPYLRLKINKEASQILVIWYSLHILQYMIKYNRFISSYPLINGFCQDSWHIGVDRDWREC
jgi:hypothetical protein